MTTLVETDFAKAEVQVLAYAAQLRADIQKMALEKFADIHEHELRAMQWAQDRERRFEDETRPLRQALIELQAGRVKANEMRFIPPVLVEKEPHTMQDKLREQIANGEEREPW